MYSLIKNAKDGDQSVASITTESTKPSVQIVESQSCWDILVWIISAIVSTFVYRAYTLYIIQSSLIKCTGTLQLRVHCMHVIEKFTDNECISEC